MSLLRKAPVRGQLQALLVTLAKFSDTNTRVAVPAKLAHAFSPMPKLNELLIAEPISTGAQQTPPAPAFAASAFALQHTCIVSDNNTATLRVSPLALLLSVSSLRSLVLSGPSLPAGALAAAARTLPLLHHPTVPLQSLSLAHQSHVTDSDLAALLPCLPSLRSLHVPHARTLSDGFLSMWAEGNDTGAHVGSWPCVQSLDVSATAVTDKGILRLLGGPAPLRRPASAMAAWLCAHPVTPVAATALESLRAAGCAVSDSLLRSIAARCPRLVLLDVSRSLVTFDGLSTLLPPKSLIAPMSGTLPERGSEHVTTVSVPVLSAPREVIARGVARGVNGGRDLARLAQGYAGTTTLIYEDINEMGM